MTVEDEKSEIEKERATQSERVRKTYKLPWTHLKIFFFNSKMKRYIDRKER